MKTFETIKQAAAFINKNSNTGGETTVNDAICFGMGVYAYKSECEKAGIVVGTMLQRSTISTKASC